MKGEISKGKRYPKELKIEAVRLHLENGLGVKVIAKKLGIAAHSTIWQWIQKYNKDGEDGLNDNTGCKGIPRPNYHRTKLRKNTRDKDAYIKQLEMENELLKKLTEYIRRDGPKS